MANDKQPRDDNPNENCLVDMQCPNCGAFAPFTIEVVTTVKVYDSGTDAPEGDMAWDDSASCSCISCGHAATVAEFKGVESTAAPQSARGVIDAIKKHESELERLRDELETMYVKRADLKVGATYTFRDKYDMYQSGKLESLTSPVGPHYVELRVDLGLSSGAVLCAVPGDRLFAE